MRVGGRRLVGRGSEVSSMMRLAAGSFDAQRCSSWFCSAASAARHHHCPQQGDAHLEVDDHEEDGHGGQQLDDVGQALAVERVLLNREKSTGAAMHR